MSKWSDRDTRELIMMVGMAGAVIAAFCPSWFTTASDFFHEEASFEGNVKRIRAGYIVGSAIVIGTGWAISSNSKNNTALLSSILVCLIFAAGYEYMIYHPASGDN